MSTALAIASVTYVLKDLLNNGLIDHDVSSAVGNVTVTALPPDRINTADSNQQSQLNLFLYRVTPNMGWRNVDLPSRNGNGDRLTNPPLALDLHYLLTSYGLSELHGEILLGYGMQLLHDTPVLARDAIRRSLAPPVEVAAGLPPELLALATSELAEQVEQVKLTPETLSTEDISKLWASFESKFRPSSAYMASVVLIESRHSTKSALPVRARNVYVRPFRHPVIEKIMSQATSGDPIVEDQPILADYNLLISGKNLRGDGHIVTVDGVEVIEGLLVKVNGIEVIPEAVNVTDTQITVPLTDENLRAGIQGVQVKQSIDMGTPEVPHRGVESNVEAFVLHPRIESLVVTNIEGTGINPRSASVELTANPKVGETQRVILLLNQIPPDETDLPLSYSFTAPPGTELSPFWPSGILTFPISGVSAGTYLVRVQVDGAESPLGSDPNGKYDSPAVTIP